MSRTLYRSSHHHPSALVGIAGAALAVALLPGIAAAQDPTPDGGSVRAVPDGPDAQRGTVIVTGGPDGGESGMVIVGGGTLGVGPDAVPPWHGSCGAAQVVTVGPDGQTVVDAGPVAVCGETGPGFGVHWVGEAPVPIPGPWGLVTPGGPGAIGTAGTVTVMAEPSAAVTVTGVDGSTVSLETDDGWTRDLDTTSVAITLDSDTLSAADLAVGDRVLVVQVRNANDTYTVTGLQLILPEVAGVVSDVTADGFTVTGMDGTRTVVRVSGETAWPPALPGGAATGLDALKDGDTVVARGKLAEDGSMDASSVLVATTITVGTGEMGMPPTPVDGPLPTPEASPQG